MESAVQEELPVKETETSEALKENDAVVKEDVNNDIDKQEAPEAAKIPEINDCPKPVHVIENDVVPEPISEETNVQEVPVEENSTNEIVEAPTVIREVVDSVVVGENRLVIEEPVEKHTSAPLKDEKEPVKDESEMNALETSDGNMTLPLVESTDELDGTELIDENVSSEVSLPITSETSQEDNAKEVEDVSVEAELVPLSPEPAASEVTECPVEQPPVLEETEKLDETVLINGMPVLQKEVVTEVNDNNISEDVVMFLPNLADSECIENINEEASVSIVSEETVKDEDESSKEVIIPPHILGRNLERPMMEEYVRNGKVIKPRLGVKIPNRNLTSQIVSGKEIEDEIMERSRLRNATADIPVGGDVFFAKKLTQRLAKKLTEKASSTKTTPTTSIVNVDVKPFIESSNKITDNSDLIALLEGDDDIDWTPTNSSKKLAEKRTPEWERETALKQLRDLPKHVKPGRGSASKTVTSPSRKSTETVMESMEELPVTGDDSSEPKFSMGVVTKTYTRKRKSSNDIKLITASILQSQKKIHFDKEKSSSATSSPHTPQSSSKQSEKSSPQKSVENSKASTPKSQKSKHSDKKEMPTLKKESPIVNQPKQTTPKVQKLNEDKYSQISPEKAHPQVIITKTITETPPIVPEPIAKVQLSPNTYISKSSRIVKKKKIWDPDEDIVPKYLKPSVTKSPKIVEAVEKAPEKKAEKVPEKKAEKVPEKKVEKVSEKAEKVSEKGEARDKPAVLKPINDRTIHKKPKLKKIMKKKKPKRLTEVDRLLMDEGAVNLLYSVKTEELQNVIKKKKSVISLDRAHRELQNKTNELKNDLQINSTKDSPISLRKKESVIKISPIKEIAAAILQRKKSTGSAHSPPASPAFYNQHAEASRIIRRHSSSSFSSENPEADDGTEKSSSKRSAEQQKKKIRTHSERHSSSMGVDKQLLSEEMAKNFNNAIPVEPKFTQFQTFNVRNHDHFVQIILSPCGPFGKTTMSVETLTELTAILNILKNDDDCRALLISSSGASFCQGIDYTKLVSNDKAERLSLAENYAKCVKKFLVAVTNFPKVLVAGVHGHTIGMGVTMLPLFDIVLASDTATFSTPYTTLGCAAEGGILLTLPHVMHNALASELLYASRKLTAGEGFRLGLVTRTLWPDKFQDELINSLKLTSGQSLQSMRAIKNQLRHHLIPNIEKALAAESLVLIHHWTSTECQSKFPDYVLESK